MNVDNDFQFEERLRVHLRRTEAPASLANTVLSRIPPQPRRIFIFPLRVLQIQRVAAMFVLAALIGVGAESLRHHRQAQQRAQAERNFARSLELTSRALEPVRQHFRQAGIALDE